jgi:hypothetical protein
MDDPPVYCCQVSEASNRFWPHNRLKLSTFLNFHTRNGFFLVNILYTDTKIPALHSGSGFIFEMPCSCVKTKMTV